ncbi:MAG: (2Fe-2S)-binding protein [Firmicutes bacterium]|nr:(2Fe-2S)-binding protein [Bacillota bacterium]
MADKDVIICRCEDLTREEVRKLIEAGFTTIEEIKRVSRCGMGPCQGRTCHQLLVREIASITGQSAEEIAPAVARPPIKGVKLGTLLKEAESHE